MPTSDDNTLRDQPHPQQPAGLWRATAAPVPPEPAHRPDRFTGSDDYEPVHQQPRGVMGRLGARMVAASHAWAGTADQHIPADPYYRGPAPHSAGHPPVYVFPRGRGWVRLSVVFALACWLIWLAYDLVELGSPGEPIRGLPLAVFVAVVAYWLTRLAGYLVRVTWERGPRRSTLLPNVVTAVFIVLCGVAFLSRTPFAIEPLWDLLSRELWQ
ncbi:MAG: hypothetical protein ACRDPW_02030 [Mycobacteriales bacterium]